MPCIIPLHTYGKYHSSILKLAIFGPLSIHPNIKSFFIYEKLRRALNLIYKES